ncbi:hypothetical protein ABPG75_001338 [Micractinium tetrahymenae]
MAAHATASFRPARCPVARCPTPKAALQPRCRPVTAAAAAAAPAAMPRPAPAAEQSTEAACSRQQLSYPTAGWASVAPVLIRQKMVGSMWRASALDATALTGPAPTTPFDSQVPFPREHSNAPATSAADAAASPSLQGKSLLAVACLLHASHPATFDAISAATRATLDDPAAAEPWLHHLLAAHGEPLSLLARGGVTALVATDAGLLGFVEVAADAADSLQRAGRRSEALSTALAGLQLVCRLRFGPRASPGPFLPAIHTFQRVLTAASSD